LFIRFPDKIPDNWWAEAHPTDYREISVATKRLQYLAAIYKGKMREFRMANAECISIDY
jgi:hypothetical protein